LSNEPTHSSGAGRQRSWRLALSAVFLMAVSLASGAWAQPEGAAPALSLEGTWHVLVHYTDSDTADAEVVRWDDRVWVFEQKGSRLRWTEYPIVVFSDRSGRFERSQHGQRRVLHAWEPNAIQSEQIEEGLEFNSRGSKAKSLRRKRNGNWQSAGAAQVRSASVVGYHETWSIDWVDGAPTFTRDDTLGSERAEAMSGRTLYQGRVVSSSGDRVEGEFARDESRRGTFRMVRSGEARSVGTKRSQRERMRDAMQFMQDPSVEAADDAE